MTGIQDRNAAQEADTDLSRLAMRSCVYTDDATEAPINTTMYRGFLVGEAFFPTTADVDRYIEWATEQWQAAQ